MLAHWPTRNSNFVSPHRPAGLFTGRLNREPSEDEIAAILRHIWIQILDVEDDRPDALSIYEKVSNNVLADARQARPRMDDTFSGRKPSRGSALRTDRSRVAVRTPVSPLPRR
jgi:hypothetical protein